MYRVHQPKLKANYTIVIYKDTIHNVRANNKVSLVYSSELDICCINAFDDEHVNLLDIAIQI